MTCSARHEREALADLALAVGEDGATLRAGWRVRDLVVDLLVRERNPLGSAGRHVPALAGVTRHARARWHRADFALLVDQLRQPRIAPAAVPAADRTLNTHAFFVAHEDLRRALPGWAPRALTPAQQEALWEPQVRPGPGLGRRAGPPLVLTRTDTGETATVRPGPAPAVARGTPAELVLFCHGRAAHQVAVSSGPTSTGGPGQARRTD